MFVAAQPTRLTNLLQAQDGVITVVDALALLGRPAVRWRVGRGWWQRPCRGVLVAHSGPLTVRQQLWVVLLRAGPTAVLAGLSAALLDGLLGFETATPHLLVPPGTKLAGLAGAVVHRSGLLGEADVHPVRRPRRTRLPRSLIDAAAWTTSDNRARAILAAGVQQRLVRVGDLAAVVARMPRLPRRRVIVATLHDVDGGAQALSEIDFLALARTYRLPPPDRQVVRRDSRGRRRWLDVCWDRYGVVVEIDGMWHMEAAQWWADLRRDNELTVGGELVLRYPAYVVREEPDVVAAQVRALLRSRGWAG